MTVDTILAHRPEAVWLYLQFKRKMKVLFGFLFYRSMTMQAHGSLNMLIVLYLNWVSFDLHECIYPLASSHRDLFICKRRFLSSLWTSHSGWAGSAILQLWSFLPFCPLCLFLIWTVRIHFIVIPVCLLVIGSFLFSESDNIRWCCLQAVIFSCVRMIVLFNC